MVHDSPASFLFSLPQSLCLSHTRTHLTFSLLIYKLFLPQYLCTCWISSTCLPSTHSLGFNSNSPLSQRQLLTNPAKVKVQVKLLSRIRLLATPWTAAHEAPPSMGFSRQEYWSAWWATVHGSQRVGHDWATNSLTFPQDSRQVVVGDQGGLRRI